MNIQELKEDGFQVRVYHGRVFTDTNGHIYTDENGTPDVMNKKEFNDLKLVFDRACEEHGMIISSFGGFTKVTISKNNKEFTGKYNVPKGKQFNRKLGFQIAFGKALKQFNNFWRNVSEI